MNTFINVVASFLSQNGVEPVLVGFAIVTYTGLVFSFLQKRREMLNKKKEKFFDILTKALKTNTVYSLEDVINIYKGVVNVTDDDTNYKSGLKRWLHGYLIYLYDHDLVSGELSKFKNLIYGWIKEIEKEAPFADLPENERNLMNDIFDYLKSYEDSDNIKRKLGELSSSIQARYDSIKQLKNLNQWSTSLAIVGFILTIIFGILSYFK